MNNLTIDQAINKLTELKKELGGETAIKVLTEKHSPIKDETKNAKTIDVVKSSMNGMFILIK